MLAQVQSSWPPQLAFLFHSASAPQKTSYLLGEQMGPLDTTAIQRSRDLAVKLFLCQINTFRRSSLGLKDLRGAFNPPTECSLQEALAWEESMNAGSED